MTRGCAIDDGIGYTGGVLVQLIRDLAFAAGVSVAGVLLMTGNSYLTVRRIVDVLADSTHSPIEVKQT